MRTPRSGAHERGAAALEFAIVLPVLLLLIMGMIDFGMVMNAQAVVTNAARDGARAGSLGKKYADTTINGTPTSGIKTMITNETTGLTGTVTSSACVAATIDGDFTTTCSTSAGKTDYDATGATPDGSIVRVQVSYTYTYITPLPALVGIGSTAVITKWSYMRIEDGS